MENTAKLILTICTICLLIGCETKSNEPNVQTDENESESVLQITPMSLNYSYIGGSSEVNIVSDNAWESEINRVWISLSPNKGQGNLTIILNVLAAEVNTTTDTAIVVIRDDNGNAVSLHVIRAGNPYLEKCSASNYRQVKIGNQIWMAENYMCSKYDTQSEAYKSGLYNIPSMTSTYMDDKPFFVNSSDTSLWLKESNNADNISEADIYRLGYLYNWSAAVGDANGGTRSSAYSGNRQGICPNGWHIPSKEEWSVLMNFIGGTSTAGKKLKDSSGWFSDSKSYSQAIDNYGFSALPSGISVGLEISQVGTYCGFWSSTPVGAEAVYKYTFGCGDALDFHPSTVKWNAISVRCLKN